MDEPAQPVFSEYGYLMPPGPHKGSLCHIRLHFVEGTISPKYRAQLFILMEGVIHSFCELLHTDCVQIWIGGVFISNIPEPECTDLCIFISPDSFNNADKHARECISRFMHPSTDSTHTADCILQNMCCNVHVLIDETDDENPFYLVCQHAKAIMEEYYHWDKDHHPRGYFIYNAEGIIEDDTRQTETAQ